MTMLTIVSAWYIFKSKFDKETYSTWIDNFLGNVKNANIVVYTNKNSFYMLEKYNNQENIKIILKELEEFKCYQYKNEWINNHEKNLTLNGKISWEVNMLWNEKINFVNETIKNNYFPSDFYAWCDIGYFRGDFGYWRTKNYSLTIDEIKQWPNPEKIKTLKKDKIYYCLVCFDLYYKHLSKTILRKNNVGLPRNPISPTQVSVAGGFFIIHRDKINYWYNAFYSKLELYFKHDYLVKDDQMILIDCIVSDIYNFEILKETDIKYDKWFYFQRFLL